MQAGQQYRWIITMTKTAASTAATVYTVRIGTNASTADTSRWTVTSAAQTAVVDGGIFVLTLTVRNVGAAGVLAGGYGFAGKKAADAVGFGNSFQDNVAASFDNSALAGQKVGLSVNPGAASSWVLTSVYAELVA